MILPGPGDIKYVLLPGSIEIPLEKAPSGHLVMVIDAYDAIRVGASGALPTQLQEFHAEPPQTASSTLHPEATQQGPASEPPDAPRMGEVIQRANAARQAMAQVLEFITDDFVRGVHGDTSSSSRDSHLPDLPPLEEDPAAPQ